VKPFHLVALGVAAAAVAGSALAGLGPDDPPIRIDPRGDAFTCNLPAVRNSASTTDYCSCDVADYAATSGIGSYGECMASVGSQTIYFFYWEPRTLDAIRAIRGDSTIYATAESVSVNKDSVSVPKSY
jgi:hypothetical protein